MASISPSSSPSKAPELIFNRAASEQTIHLDSPDYLAGLSRRTLSLDPLAGLSEAIFIDQILFSLFIIKKFYSATVEQVLLLMLMIGIQALTQVALILFAFGCQDRREINRHLSITRTVVLLLDHRIGYGDKDAVCLAIKTLGTLGCL